MSSRLFQRRAKTRARPFLEAISPTLMFTRVTKDNMGNYCLHIYQFNPATKEYTTLAEERGGDVQTLFSAGTVNDGTQQKISDIVYNAMSDKYDAKVNLQLNNVTASQNVSEGGTFGVSANNLPGNLSFAASDAFDIITAR